MSAKGTVRTVLMALLAVVAGGALLAACVIEATGVVSVSVREKKPDGTHIAFFVPAVVVPVAMRFVPEKEIRNQSRDLQRWLPAIRIASRELARTPDGPLVEIRSRDQNVSIVKSGDSIIVNVDDPDETVHVSCPLAVVSSVVEKLESDAQPI